MKSTLTAAALLIGAAVFVATPASAQYRPGAPNNTMSGTTPPAPNGEGQGPGERQQPQKAQQAAQQDENAIKTHMPKISRDASKQIQTLQKDVNDKNAAAIAADAAAANAAAKSGDDRYVIGLLQLKAAAQANDNAGIAAAIEAMLASGSVLEGEKFPLYLNLGQIYSSTNQDARATAAFKQAIAVNPNSVDATAGLAESLVAQGQVQQGLDLLEKGIALQSAGGATAPQSWYKRAVAVAYKAKLPAAIDLSRRWVAAYPTTDAWQNSLAIYQNLIQLPEAEQLDLLRLKRAVGAMTPSDYFNFGDIAVRKGYSGEAKAVLEEGFAANAVNPKDPSFSQLYSVATQKTKGDKESLPAAPQADKTATQTLNVGDAWYGYSDYAKAAEFYRAALAKPGADKDLANLHLGMALARQGDKAGASAALAQVGGDETQLGKYWLLYASTKI